MAKTKGPLFSLEAHGSLAKTLNYSRRQSGSQCRTHHKPTGIPSAKQRGQRRLTEFLIAQWQNMSAGDKATWAANARTSGLNLSGYHFFLRSAQRDLYTHHGLCGYWHCNEIVDGQVLDLSGNGYHCDLEPSYPSNAPVLVASEKTRFGSALQYDGVNDYVANLSTPKMEFGTDIDFTIVVVVKILTGIGDYKGLVGKASSGGLDGFFLRHRTDGLISFRLDSTTNKRVTSTSDYRDRWAHVFGVCNRDSFMRLYINGALEDSDTGFAETLSYSKEFNLGAYGHGAFSKAIIDEVCVYNRALSPAEIATRYKFATTKV